MGQNKPRWSRACQFTNLMFSFYLNKKRPSFFVRGAPGCYGCLSSFVEKPTRLPVSLQTLWIMGSTRSSTGLVINKKIGIFFNLFLPFLHSTLSIWKCFFFPHAFSHTGSTFSSSDHKILIISFFQSVSNQPLSLPHPGLNRTSLWSIPACKTDYQAHTCLPVRFKHGL